MFSLFWQANTKKPFGRHKLSYACGLRIFVRQDSFLLEYDAG